MKQAIGARWGGVNGVASVIARIIEIVLWLGVAWLVVGAVLLYMNRSAIVVDADANRVYADSISVSGSFLDVDVYLGRGRMRDEVYYPLVALVLVAQLAILVCMALVFHEIADVCLRLKEWEHSRGGLEGPFGERMVRSFRFVGSRAAGRLLGDGGGMRPAGGFGLRGAGFGGVRHARVALLVVGARLRERCGHAA